jgi:hypothetical protein
MGVGLDLITLPSHISCALQSFDVSCFKPFKTIFKTYKNVWTLANKGRGANKEDLAQWVSLTLKKTLTTTTICKGILAIMIWPLNPDVMVNKMQPFKTFMDSELET